MGGFLVGFVQVASFKISYGLRDLKTLDLLQCADPVPARMKRPTIMFSFKFI